MSLDTVIAHMKSIADLSWSSGNHPMHKRALLDLYFAASPETLNLVPSTTIKPVLVGDLPCEWILPATCQTERRLLYVHGGSWMAGSSSSHRALISRIAEASQSAVLALNYRLAPEFPFPNGLEDVIHGFQWLIKHGPDSEILAERCYIAGDSAGGNLALASVLALKEQQHKLPDACVLLSPAIHLNYQRKNLTDNNDPILSLKALPYVVANYLQEQATLNNPLVSPVFGDLNELPPTLLQVGDREILLQDAQEFIDAAQQQGSPVALSVFADMPHVFQGFAPILPEANQAIAEIGEFFRQN
ncbi:alpha/beta hydrolase [Sessilibacter sp. MAH1]